MGGKISEEFMCISSSGEDTILVNDEGTVGINTEVLEMPNALDYLEKNYGIRDLSALHQEHCIELGHIFQLGQRYSKAMGCYFKTQNNIDDRLDVSLGVKIKDAKLLGAPYLVIIGTQAPAESFYELESRVDGTKSICNFEKLVEL